MTHQKNIHMYFSYLFISVLLVIYFFHDVCPGHVGVLSAHEAGRRQIVVSCQVGIHLHILLVWFLIATMRHRDAAVCILGMG